MKKLFSLLAVIALTAIFTQTSFTQLSGSYTIPGSYATISAAVTALNTNGVSGPVVFNVAAGHTETSANITLTNTTPNSTNTVTFQKSGAGANPLITAAAGTGTLDGIVKFAGTDYVTFDGIDVTDPTTNITTTTKMEWGYAILKASATDASQNIIIRNCVINVNTHTTIYTSTKGIYTGNHTTASITSLVITAASGTISNCQFYSNTINTAYVGIELNGYNAASPYTLYDQNNDIGVAGANTINSFGGSSSTGYGVYAIYQNDLEVENNTIIGGTHGAFLHTTTLYGVFLSTGINSNADVHNNTITLTSSATTSQMSAISNAMGGTGTTNTINITNNTVQNCVWNTVTSGNAYLIYHTSSSYNLNITGNTVTNFTAGNGTSTSTGTISGIYTFGGNSTAGSQWIFANNTITNLNRSQSAASTGLMYLIYNSTTGRTFKIYNNNINTCSNNSTSSVLAGLYFTGSAADSIAIYGNTIHTLTKGTGTTTGALYGIYNNQSSPVSNTYNNTVYGLSTTPTTSTNLTYGYYNNGSGTTTENFVNNTFYNFSSNGTGAILGALCQTGGTPSKNISNNLIYNITAGTGAAGGQAAGLQVGYLTTANIFNNKIYNLISYNATGLSPATFGLATVSSGTTFNIYNNYIHELKAPNATVALPNTSIIGFLHNFGAANFFYNTIYLDATGTGAVFSSAAVYSNTTYNLDMRNNILINKSTPNGTGISVVHHRSSTTLASYQTTSDRNNLYAGTPSANNLIYYDGTNSDQTLSAYKTRVSPKDANSVTENTTFVNTSSSPYDLHIATCTATQVESNGAIVSSPISITTDFDGNARYNNAGYPQCSTFTATAPDMGADEFGGIGIDAVGPTISYTLLGNAIVSTNRSFTSITITDASGINNSAGTKPRCYYKKSTDANAYNGNTFFDDGWKWVEANGSSSPYDFTIDYTILNGGSVTSGDVIQYFVTAQDLASTPNIGINSGTYAGSPTSVADYANMFPLGGTINQYLISSTYSGVYSVGTNFGDNFTTLTGAGGLFAALNAGVMTGNITAVITTNLTEDGTNDLNSLSYDVAGANYTLKIVPFDASEKLISGSVANSLIRFDGNDYVTIDGNNGLDAAGTKYLRFRNTNGSNPTISIQNDSRNNTITNCVIESNCTGTLGAIGTIVVGSTTGPQGNDSLFITDCDIRDNSDASGTPITAILASGNASFPNDYLTITGCNIYNTYNASATFVDLYIIAGNDNVTVSGNSIYQTSTRSPSNAAAYFSMIFASNGRIDLTNNYLGGTAPSCGGSPTTFTDGGGYLGFRLFQTSTGSASTVSGNTIANIDYSTTGTGSSFFFRAIDVNGNPSANVNVTGNTVGSQLGNDNIVLRYNPGAGTGSPTPCAIGFGFNSAVTGYPLGSVTNNTIGGITLTGTGTTSGTAFSFTQIGIGTTVNTAVNVTGNTVGGSTANSIRNTLTSTVSVLMNGISSGAITNTTGVNISNNTVRNLTNNSTATSTNTLLRGIFHSGSAGFTCNSNTVNDLTTTSGNTSGTSPSTASLVGILSTSASLNQSISQNTVYGLTNANTGTGSVHAIGLGINNSSATGTVTRNRIYDISIPNTTGGSPAIMGIDNWFGSWTISNNQVTLTNDEATFDRKVNRNSYDNSVKTPVSSFVNVNSNINIPGNLRQNKINEKNTVRNPLVTEGEIAQPENTDHEKQTDNNNSTGETDMSTTGVLVYGIFDDATSTQNYYYNSVYIGGSQNSGANNSAAFRKSTSTKVLANNLFFNARVNGGTATGKHFAVISGNATISSNYNVYVSSNSATICLNNATDQTIDQWRTSASGQDNQTWSTTSSVINASNLFSNISSGNLNINTANSEAWLVSGKGIAITGQSTDFSGNSRFVSVGSGTTDIGSNEIGALGMTPPSATVDNPPGDGVVSTYSLWGRSIIRITWGTGGSEYPTSLNTVYYSGVNPPNVLGGNYSNSYTTVNATGNLNGATYDIIYYFGDNETYTIGTPGASTILAKYGTGGTWEVYHLTQPNSNSVLTYNTTTKVFNVAVSGLFDFSTFALTDDGSALPVTMESFDITVRNRDAHLSWVTLSEINNKGFAIERRLKTESGYTQWKELGFVNGNGTTTERHQYTFKDAKLVTGAYQYRLKQVDFSNNVEYYQPTNNSDVIIGKPGVFDISQNYPNPSNPKSKIDFAMPFDGKVSIKVYDILGKEVATLVNEFKSADFYTVEFDGTNIASGTYFYRIVAEGDNQKFTKTLKMILVK